MSEYTTLRDKIFQGSLPVQHDLIWQVYQFQYHYNPVYKRFVDLLGRYPREGDIFGIPFLPVELFKAHEVICSNMEVQGYFESSGTTGSINSRHYIADYEMYKQSYLLGFESVYGAVAEWTILGLLPSYLEREHASLVYMVKGLMEQSSTGKEAFYLYDYQKLYDDLSKLKEQGKKVLLFGVTFALLDFAAKFKGYFPHLTIIETGGMKGRGKELTREELHLILKEAFGPAAIHSEYGMTEMLSQAYSTDRGVFYPSPTMKVLKRDAYDPLLVSDIAGRGMINVIDLSNLQSCSFIATQDIGLFHEDGSFEVLGRADHSDVRGCNLMVEGLVG
jgi:hypothetical protein